MGSVVKAALSEPHWGSASVPVAANSRLPSVVAIFPVIGNAGVAEDEPDKIGEARLGANIVRQDDDAALTGLDADHGVGRLAVVAALVEAAALRAVEDDDAQAGVQILALLTHRQVGKERGELMGSGDMQPRVRHSGARGCTQAIAAYQGGNEVRQVGNRGIHRARRAHLAALVMFLRLALVV